MDSQPDLLNLQQMLLERSCSSTMARSRADIPVLKVPLKNGLELVIDVRRVAARTNSNGFVTSWRTVFYMAGKVVLHGAPRPIMRECPSISGVLRDLENLGVVAKA